MQVTIILPLEKTGSSCYPHYFIKIYTKYKTSEEEIRFIEEKIPPDVVTCFAKDWSLYFMECRLHYL